MHLTFWTIQRSSNKIFKTHLKYTMFVPKDITCPHPTNQAHSTNQALSSTHCRWELL